MLTIKQDETTAALRRATVYLVDIGDGFTPETGIAAPTIEISKNGAAQGGGVGTWTEIGDGIYYYTFTAGEIDTLGFISLRVVSAGVTRDFVDTIQIVAYNPYVALATESDLEDARFDDGVFISNTNGSAGTTYDIGTRGNPSDNIPDATIIATARGVRKFVFLDNSVYALAQPYTDWNFSSESGAILNIGGQTITGSAFDRMGVYGNIGFPGMVTECLLLPASNARGYFWRCGFSDTFAFAAGSISIWNSIGTPTFDCTSLGANTAHIQEFAGNITITNLTAGTINLMGVYGQVTLDASCTGGTINLLGEIALTDNSAGSTVNKTDAMIALSEIDSELTGTHDAGSWAAADVSTLAVEANVEGHATDALNTYDPPTKTELDTAISTVNSAITLVKADTAFIRQVESGKWKIVGNQMIFYRTNGTVLMRFDLKDADGNATMQNVFERVPV